MIPKYLESRLTFGFILFFVLGVIWFFLKVMGKG